MQQENNSVNFHLFGPQVPSLWLPQVARQDLDEFYAVFSLNCTTISDLQIQKLPSHLLVAGQDLDEFVVVYMKDNWISWLTISKLENNGFTLKFNVLDHKFGIVFSQIAHQKPNRIWKFLFALESLTVTDVLPISIALKSTIGRKEPNSSLSRIILTPICNLIYKKLK